ncbi:MAG TPA: sugar phosphate nucleotidyltransferase [Candidatus Saccharimonadales bacterium]|nr:sugar phosphate nucleotidyltransferase [Candidatus Saccharimonadales bacterium]
MIVALIAGGAGTRLWPLSTPDYPKHLLTVTGDRSLLQSSYERAKCISGDIYVVTEASHAHHVKDQLPELPPEAFIIEPARRGTSGCFLAMLVLAKRRHGDDEPLAITWADHFIRDVEGYAETFKAAGAASQKYNLPVFIGVEPTYPSTGLGYIHKDGLLPDEQLVHKSAGFKEKPDQETAQTFLASGEYLWNTGYLVGTVRAFETAMQKDCPDLWQDYQKLFATEDEESYKQAYLALESVAVDYTFNERVHEALVVPGTFDWLDLGSFKDLYTVTDSNQDGNCVMGDKIAVLETQNSYIRNDDSSKPVAVIGLDNVVVVNTPAGILVARKDLSQMVKEASKELDAS